MRLIKTICILLIVILEIAAQGVGSSGANSRIDGRYKIVPVPYADYNRSLGFALGFLPMVQFNPVLYDTLSPSSMGGALAMYTTNETWFLMAFTKMYFDADNWRITAAGGIGSVNFQFYLESPINNYVPYNTAADFAFIEVQKRIIKGIYFGVNYVYMNLKTKSDIYPVAEETKLNGLGILFSRDTRPSVYYPYEGSLSNIRYNIYPEFMGNEFISEKIQLDYNHYFPMRDDLDVLAVRFFGGIGIGDLSFNQQFIVGQKTDLRGYTQGKYRGDYLYAIQAEYRRNFTDSKWGLVAYGGIATVYGSFNSDHDGKLLPAIGTGFRYNIFPENHMNVGMDIAIAIDDWGIYFRIAEAF